MPTPPPGSSQEMLGHYHRRQSRWYRWLRPPLPLILNPAERHLPPREGLKLWIGGAAGSVPAGFINCDAEPFPGVDVAGDVQALPFRNDCFAAIECDAVLEHVEDPQAAVRELVRVLQPGGILHLVVPFNHPFHSFPSDFHRWTMQGLRDLLICSCCTVVAEGVRTGPTATMLTFFCEYCRLAAPARLGRPMR